MHLQMQCLQKTGPAGLNTLTYTRSMTKTAVANYNNNYMHVCVGVRAYVICNSHNNYARDAVNYSRRQHAYNIVHKLSTTAAASIIINYYRFPIVVNNILRYVVPCTGLK
jgi:hypothetical protein